MNDCDFVKTALQLKLSTLIGLKDSLVVWSDIRVSRGYFKATMLNKFPPCLLQALNKATGSNVNYAKKNTRTEPKEKICADLANLMRGEFDYLLPSYPVDHGR